VSGVIDDLSVHGILADSVEMRDNVLWCSKEALSLGLGSQRKACIRRNTILGATTIDLSYGAADDTITSNIFNSVNFTNESGMFSIMYNVVVAAKIIFLSNRLI
jgi:hypothetical protein